MDEFFLFSACLLGVPCRYNGRDSRCAGAEKTFAAKGGLAVCPEQLGGLPTPREPAVMTRGRDGVRVMTKSGSDVTGYFEKGCRRAAEIAAACRVTHAVLKEASPSCGVMRIHGASGLESGCGLFTEELIKLGVEVSSDEDADSKNS